MSGKEAPAADPLERSANTMDPRADLACVILAHTDPTQLRRLIEALSPFPVFLHIDSRASDAAFQAMVANLPDRVVLLSRIATGWAKWENVEAELNGYRAALQATGAPHIALMTGADYPLASAAEISRILRSYRGKSFAEIHQFPHPRWGRNGGISRLRYRHWVFRKHMLRLPIPRSVPSDVTLAGGSQLKVLSRDHARAVVRAADEHSSLVRFWRRSWIADETFVPSVLSTAQFVPDWEKEHVEQSLWWIGWDDKHRKSPPWLGMPQWDLLRSRRMYSAQEIPSLFARKFSTTHSSRILDAIDDTFGLRLRRLTPEAVSAQADTQPMGDDSS